MKLPPAPVPIGIQVKAGKGAPGGAELAAQQLKAPGLGRPTGQGAVQIGRFQGDALEGYSLDLGGQVHLGSLPGTPNRALGFQGGKGRARRQGQGAGAGQGRAKSDIHAGLGEGPPE